MIKTLVTERLGIQYPIIAGTMMNITTPEFVAACCEAGGLGILASAIYKTKDDLRTAIKRTRQLTTKPYAVNVNLFPALMPTDQLSYIKIMLEEGVRIIETSGHAAPQEYVPIFKEAGVTWIHKCAGVRYAVKAASLGADMVEVVGYENGGATGKLDVGTMVMTPSVVDALSIPVIAGGGVSDGRGLAAVLALGAEAAIIGTRIMATRECPIHDNLKKALLEAAETDTVLIMRSLDSTHRVWNNAAAQRVLDLEAGKPGDPQEIFEAAAGSKAKKMYNTGDLDIGVVSCGQGVGLIHDIPRVKDLFDRIIKEAETVIAKLSVRKTRIAPDSSPA
ncbi:MAG: nitronate monooxygenase [Deltaproteobacteria bacterium]|nr:nitronate monooxygenase [Deltaproteobacteria bacterium]